MGHTPLFTPLLDGTYKGFRYFGVVDKVNPAETYFFLIPGLIGFIVDNGCYASYDSIILISKKIVGFAKLESGVFLLVEGVEHIIVEVGY